MWKYFMAPIVGVFILGYGISIYLDKLVEAQEPVTVQVADWWGLKPGDVVEIPVMLSKAPLGLSGFSFEIEASGDAIEIQGGDTAFFGELLSVAPNRVAVSGVDLSDIVTPGMESIELVTLTVQAVRLGTSTVSLAIVRMDNDSGGPFDAVAVAGTVSVGMPTLQGQLLPVADLDGDGLADDLNGNGRRDFMDIVLLFKNLGRPEVSIFDYDGNGSLGFNDVVVMFDRMIEDGP